MQEDKAYFLSQTTALFFATFGIYTPCIIGELWYRAYTSSLKLMDDLDRCKNFGGFIFLIYYL